MIPYSKMIPDSKTRWAWRWLLWRSYGIGLLRFLAIMGAVVAAYRVVQPIWIIGAVAIYTLFRVEQMREKQSATFSDKHSFLLKAEPGPPRHEAPRPPSASGRFGDEIEANRAFFRDFAGFANAMNGILNNGQWRLHQLADPYILTSNGIGIGLNYHVSYGQALIGEIAIWPISPLVLAHQMGQTEPEYNSANSAVSARIWFSATKVDFYLVWDFLDTIASRIASGSREEYLSAREAMTNRLLAILWNAQLQPMDVALTISGTPNVRFFEPYAAAA